MMKSDHTWRPPLPERYQRHIIGGAELRQMIETARQAFQNTRDNTVLNLLQQLEQAQEDERTFELICEADEIQEFWESPLAFNHTVFTWMRFYREGEMGLRE